MPPVSQTTAELMKAPQREFIIMAGKDGSGKSCAIVSIAAWVQNLLNPAATFFIIDTENKFPTALRSFGADAPTNIKYYKCEKMNDVTQAAAEIEDLRKPGDWAACESMGRVWEKAQDMGYMTVTGLDKADYLEKRQEIAKKVARSQVPVVIPKPDDFWNIVKGAHDGAFLELWAQAMTLNVVLSTVLGKPVKEDGRGFKPNQTRKEVQAEFGLDVGIEGAPRLPYYAETFCLMGMEAGAGNCRIIRDNIGSAEVTRKMFTTGGKKDFAMHFWSNCRA